MKISKVIYNIIINCPDVPPETGGILGTSNGEVINHVVFDMGISSANGGVYIPDIHFLNQTISEWNKTGIQFRGMFHTHAIQWPSLSENDRIYIMDILYNMPPEVEFLYFPLVFPGKSIKVYLAKRKRGSFDIINDGIEIVGREVSI